MAASPGVIALVDELVALFNRRSMDLPDRLFTRQTQFVLNGVPFEEVHGRSSSDPLILMLTRGPAGYRFTAKAVQYAIPDAALQRGDLEEVIADGVQVVTGQGWLSGHLRGSGDAAEILIDFELTMHGPGVARVAASLDESALAKLQEARLRP